MVSIESNLNVLNSVSQTVAAGRGRADAVCAIKKRLKESQMTLRGAIRQRQLYFRVSVTGRCNLSCRFCHNEGAPTHGLLDLELAESAIAAAKHVGFSRVQFTGGEPLLRADIADFVAVARRYVEDVGITTNGTLLPRVLGPLRNAGIYRIHISLQEESLAAAGSGSRWGIPDWLVPAIESAESGEILVRLNLPVPAHCLEQAQEFLTLLSCSVKVFSVLPEGRLRDQEYPLAMLEEVVAQANAERNNRSGAEVVLRGFRPPSGIRCSSCIDQIRCREQSHSLRLGADLILRPCLATRGWDMHFDKNKSRASIREAALLAIDYVWDDV